MDTAPGRVSRATGCGGKSSFPSNGSNLCCTSTGSQPGPSADREVGSTPTSSLPCCVTTSARTSWTLPPEDLLDAAYVPSLWAVQKTVLMVLLGIVIGPLSVASIALWPASPPQTPGFIGASPTRREGANLISDIPSGIYFSAGSCRLPGWWGCLTQLGLRQGR